MVDSNKFTNNFLSLLDNFQAKKPANQKGGAGESKKQDETRKNDKDGNFSGGDRRRETEEQKRGSRDRGRKKDFRNNEEEKSNVGSDERVGSGDSNNKQIKNPEKENVRTAENSGRENEKISDEFFSVLDKFDSSQNKGAIPKRKKPNFIKTDLEELSTSVAEANSDRNPDERMSIRNERKINFKESRNNDSFRGESSKRNYDSNRNRNENIQGARFLNKESETPIVKSCRTMGYKFLEGLLDKETNFVVTTLASPKSGFQELVNDRPIRPDLLMLILKVLDKINESEAHQLKVQILSNTFKPEFIDEIKKFVSLICVEDNRKRLLSMSTFFVNILNVLDTVVNSLPSTMNEKMKSTLNALSLSMKSLRDEHKINVSDKLFDQLKELTDQVNSSIEHKTKIEKDQSRQGKKEILPPNSYREIPLIPTKDDFMTDKGYLRQNIVRGSYSNVDHYLDVQFRLLREDFIAPLREGIYEYIDALSTPRAKRRYSNVRIYHKIKFEKSYKLRDVFGFYIRFDCDKKLPRNMNWEYNKRFMTGSLLLFSDDDFQTFYLATVAERNFERLKEGLLFVSFVPGTDVPEYLFEPGVFFVMAESEVYYEAYKHVLSALQRMNEKNFPMTQYIVEVDTACFPPVYLMDNSVYKISDYNVNLLDDKSWPSPEALKLNPSQHQALKSALTNDFVVIQGPPGTGKTFLALKITEILLKNEVSFNTPIVVICYTNHALDQFLEGILTYTKNLIRIGMQSQNEALQKYNLDNVRRNTNCSRNSDISALFRQTKSEKLDAQSKLQGVEENIEELENPKGILELNALRSVITPQHYNELGDQVVNWLFFLDDPDYHMMEGFEEASETQRETPVTQIQDETMYENLPGAKPEDSTNNAEEDFEELDEEENARRLADLTEDDFFEEDFFQESVYARNLNYSLSFDDLNSKIRSIEHEINVTTHRNLDSKYYFDQKCIEQITELEWQKRFLKKQFFRFKDFKFNPEKFYMFQNMTSIWEINGNDRWECYTTWVYLYVCQLKQIIQHLTKTYQDVLVKLQELRQLEDLQFVQTASVVGMTTSGAAKRRVLLENLGTKIVIVEEAAEVLEAHIVTSLAQSVQHVILIGDHKQLKPNPAVFKLAKKYNMDCSLFERMIYNGLGCSVLNEQHRMRPEIASLITPTIYPHLANHPSTLDRPKVRGVDRFVFFLTHDKPEDQLPDSSSKQNTHEADILMELCKYLLLNDYKPEEITILATYSGQVWYMRKKKREMGSHLPEIRNVRITPVDNFQGEENRIILLSLVRSNKENRIGFLSTENRVCVALSRAREGLYVVGNMDNLTNSSSIWPRIKQRLEEINAFGQKLLLRCERHPEQITQVTHAKDFKGVPQGGCSLKCNTELNCGHICPRICHYIDRNHEFYKCQEKCERPPCEVEGHKCPLSCWQICQPCIIKVEKKLPCGHSATLRCHEEPAAHKCMTQVPAIHPACNHEILKFCYLDAENCRCTNDCTVRLPCGHSCERRCHVNNDPDHLQYLCRKKCVKEYKGCPRKQHPCPKLCYEDCEDCKVLVETKLPCGHNHKIPCSQDPETFKCERTCNRTMTCGHKCKVPCWVECKPDNCDQLVDKEAECGHVMRKMKCSDPTSKRLCKEDCKRILDCGHQCRSKCFNECALFPCQEMVDSIVAPLCGHPQVKIPCHLNKEGLHGGSDELVQLCDQPCGKVMRCGHVCKGTCGKCIQGRLHVPCVEKCSRTLVCGHECKNACSVLCPPCLDRKCIIRCSHRKCFVPKSKNHPCFNLCTCDKKCLWSCEHHQCNRRCSDVCDRPPCYEPCPLLLNCGHSCVGFCGEVCPPVCAVCSEDDAIPGQRYVVLEDCKHVVESDVMDALVASATQHNTFRLMVCPQQDCSQPVANTMRYRHVYLGFRHQVVKIDEILKQAETQRLLRLHGRGSQLLGSNPTSSDTLNVVMNICSRPFVRKGGFVLDQKEVGRLVVSCLLQPLAVRCAELRKIKYEEGQSANKFEEQRLMFRLEYLAGALLSRLDKISYDAVLQIELMVVHILRLTSNTEWKAPSSLWFEVTPYTWEKDFHYNELERFPRLSVSLGTRDATKQWFRCDNGHLYVSEGGEPCVICKEEAEENQRRMEEEARRREEAARRREETQAQRKDHQRQNRGGRQGPVVTDFRRANACYNPIVYAISHPKYRAALNKKFPSLVCGVPEPMSSDGASVASGATTLTEDKSAAA